MSDFAERYLHDFDVMGYLSERGRVRRSGATNAVMRPCPICGDNRGKFYVNTKAGQYNGQWNSYCCHSSGNLVRLVAQIENTPEFDAVEIIRDLVDGEPDKIAIIQPGTTFAVQPPAVALVSIPGPLYPAGPTFPIMTANGVKTLADRGIDQYIIDRYHLQVSLGGTSYQGRMAPVYDHRLFIPIHAGRTLKTWQARDLTGKSDKKYVFPPGDCSASLLYGYDDFLEHRCETLLIVEGAPGKWSWDKLGQRTNNPKLQNLAVASFGKRLTLAQEDLVFGNDRIKRVIFGWDLDAAPEVCKVAERVNGRKEIFVMMPHPSGRDHDELDTMERIKLLADARPFTRELAIQMKTSLALSGQ